MDRLSKKRIPASRLSTPSCLSSSPSNLRSSAVVEEEMYMLMFDTGFPLICFRYLFLLLFYPRAVWWVQLFRVGMFPMCLVEGYSTRYQMVQIWHLVCHFSKDCC